MDKIIFKVELLALLEKFGIIKNEGSVEILIKTNGKGLLSVRINNIKNY